MRFRTWTVCAVMALTAGVRAETPDKTVTAGDFVTERPTLNPLGFEWHVTGDDNRNAVVAEYQAGSHQDAHSVLAGLDVFKNVKPTDQSNPPLLYNPETTISR